MFETVPKEHWESNWDGSVSLKPLQLNTSFHRDIDSLVRSRITGSRPKMIEIGFAPGRLLHHFEKTLNAQCVGYDYSEIGCRAAQTFLSHHNSNVSIRCQDVVENPPQDENVDLVYSIGVVEHFSDPASIVNAHLKPLKPGGHALIVMPNYSGTNLAIQRMLDPENIAIHNLELMTCKYWEDRPYGNFESTVYTYGRPSASMFSLQKLGTAGKAVQYAANRILAFCPKMFPFCRASIVVEFRAN